jgi:hypothetical protein
MPRDEHRCRFSLAARVVSGILASAWPLACAARAADAPEKRTILAARDEIFARPEFAEAAEKGPSFMMELFQGVAKAVMLFAEENPIAFKVIAAVLVLTLFVLVAHIVWTLAIARRARYDEELELPELDIRRTPPATFRGRAVSLADEGRYEDAARELYMALILVLDARGDIAYARHKALLDYRHEARKADARDAFRLFAGGYHPASFGRRSLPAERFTAMLAAVDRVSP